MTPYDICRKHDWCPLSIDSEATFLAIVENKDTENHVAAIRIILQELSYKIYPAR